jgi:hypothetical protein
MAGTKSPVRRRPDWTTWLIVAMVVMLTILAFILLASIYLPLT